MPRASSSRKRARQTYKEASSDDGSEGDPDSGVDEIIGRTKPKAPRRKSLGKGKEKQKDDDAMEVDQEADQQQDENASRAGSGSARKSATPAPAPPKRPRGRPRKSLLAEGTDESLAAQLSTTSVSAPPRRRGRPPKTKPTVDDSEPEAEVTRRGRGSKAQNDESQMPIHQVSQAARTEEEGFGRLAEAVQLPRQRSCDYR